jgi:hypothetical protein
MLPASRLFYVQDEQYVTGAWMRRSDDVQDERVVFCSCKNDTSASLGGRMSLTGAWIPKAFAALMGQALRRSDYVQV